MSGDHMMVFVCVCSPHLHGFFCSSLYGYCLSHRPPALLA